MATFIPVSGELSEVPPPRNEVSVASVLGSPGTLKHTAPDGSTWWATQPVVLSENDRATRFYNTRHGRTAGFEILYGDVLYLSAEESRALAGLSSGADDYVPVHGRTYDVRNKLKAIGARWYAQEKLWKVPKSRLTEANDIVRKGP